MTYLCIHGCGKLATYTTKHGKPQCDTHHRKCPAVLQKGYKTNQKKYGGKMPAASPDVRLKMQKTTEARYGVTNASSSDIIKNIRKKKSIESYGVDNVSKSELVKSSIRAKAVERWKEIYKGKDFTADGLSRKEYSNRAAQYADTQYKRYANIIDPDKKRSKDWHIDHIFSVTDGFLNNVPINIISDITNLRLISDKENYSKHRNSHKSLDDLYEDFYSSRRS